MDIGAAEATAADLDDHLVGGAGWVWDALDVEGFRGGEEDSLHCFGSLGLSEAIYQQQ